VASSGSTILAGPKVRIPLPPAESPRTIGSTTAYLSGLYTRAGRVALISSFSPPTRDAGPISWMGSLRTGRLARRRWSAAGPLSTSVSFSAGPMVRIRFPPAESPCLTQTRPLQVENRGFRAGVRRSVGGAVGGDAQGGAISHQRTAISLLAPIPVPPCCRHGLGCLGTCRFSVGH
jgi:hypothetical protein